jgi:hypothetical protein
MNWLFIKLFNAFTFIIETTTSKCRRQCPAFQGFSAKGGMRARRETKTNRPQRSKIIAMQQRTCSMGDTARTPFFVRLYKSRLSNYSADLLFNDH